MRTQEGEECKNHGYFVIMKEFGRAPAWRLVLENGIAIARRRDKTPLHCSLLECKLVAVPHVSWAFWKTSCLFQIIRPQGRPLIVSSDNRNFPYTPASKRSRPEKGTCRHRPRTCRTDKSCWRDRGSLAVETIVLNRPTSEGAGRGVVCLATCFSPQCGPIGRRRHTLPKHLVSQTCSMFSPV
jgi:hypothetical protein